MTPLLRPTVLIGLCLFVAPAFAAPTPSASLTLGDPLLGAPVAGTVSFDNSGDAVGYGPYLDIALPSGDGNAGDAFDDDGLGFGSASYLGTPIETTVLTFVDDGLGDAEAIHPFARDASGAPLVVEASDFGAGFGPGDTLLVLELPFGSFDVDQPPAAVDLGLTMSDRAQLAGLEVVALGGFRYGADPLDNPTADAPLRGGVAPVTVTPSLLSLNKAFDGFESETAIGPNFVRSYTLSVTLAPGQSFSDLELRDLLPNDIVYQGLTAVTLDGAPAVEGVDYTVASEPPTTGPSNGAVLELAFPNASDSASLSFDFYVPFVDADGVPIGDGGTANVSRNRAEANASWSPLDPDDPAASPSASASFELTVSNNGGGTGSADVNGVLTVQKSVSVQTDTGFPGPTPGDTLEFTLDVQISDLSAFADFELSDVLGDGLSFDPGFAPTLSYTQHGGSTPPGRTIAPSVSANTPGPGRTTLLFDVSAALVAAGDLSQDRLLGGCVDPAGGAPSCATFDGGPTEARIVYRATIDEDYEDAVASGDPSIDQGDTLGNAVTARGDVLDPTAGFVDSGQDEEDTSSSGVTVPNGAIVKSVWAIDGDTGASAPYPVQAGDLVTYRLRLELPTTDFEDLVITDYLPQPVLSASGGLTLDGDGGLPEADEYGFGPDHSYPGPAPTVGTSGGSFVFDFGSYDGGGTSTTVIDLLVSFEAQATAIADGLFLTNQAQASSSNSAGATLGSTDIVQIRYARPLLRITKSLVASDETGAVFDPAGASAGEPATPAGVSFAAPGSATPFTGTITSTGLAATAIDSDLSGVDAGDVVTYAIVIENAGSGPEGAFDLTLVDALPPGLTPGDVSNLQLRRGDGSVLSATDTGGTPLSGDAALAAALFGGGLVAVDPAAGQGALERGVQSDGSVTADGRNVVVLSYDVTLPASVVPSTPYGSDAAVTNVASEDGGASYPVADLDDAAAFTTPDAALAKTVVATSETHTAGADAATGEIVRYRLTLTLPQGTSPNLVLRDTLPPGLAPIDVGGANNQVRVAFVADADVTEAADLSSADNDAVPPSFALPDARIAVSGRDLAFALGDLVNNDTDADAEQVLIEFNARVENLAAADGGDALANAAAADADLPRPDAAGASETVELATASATVDVVEPSPSVTKTASPTGGDAGDTIVFTVTLSNDAGAATAFDLSLDDTLPAELDLTGASIDSAPGYATVTDASDLGADTVAFTVDELRAGDSVVVSYQATLRPSVTPGSSIVNAAAANATSLPGANGTSGNPTGSDTPGASGAADGERDGSDGPGGSPNDLAATGSATVTIDDPAAFAYRVATSETHTAGGDLAIGEIVRYRFVARVPEGTSPELVLRGRLPAGLRFLDDGSATVALVASADGSGGGLDSADLDGVLSGCPGYESIGTAADATTPATVDCVLPGSAVSSNLAGTQDSYGSGGDVYVALGDVVNHDTDADAEFVVVEINALLLNESGNADGIGRNTSLQVYVDGSPLDTSTNVGLTVVEPDVSVAKNVSPGSDVDAGDAVTFTLVLSNAAGAAAAFDLTLNDALPADIDLIAVTVTGAPGYATVTDASDLGADAVALGVDELRAGDSVTVELDATLRASAEAGRTLENLAWHSYTSLPGPSGTSGNATGSDTPGASGELDGERDGSDLTDGSAPPSGGTADPDDYAGSDTAEVAVRALDPTLTIDATSEGHTADTSADTAADPRPVAVGEIVRYRLVVEIPEGSSSNLRFDADLPLGLRFLDDGSARIAFVADGAGIDSDAPALSGAGLDQNGDETTLATIDPSFALPASAVDTAGGGLAFDLGTLGNDDSDPDREFVVVEFNALVEDVAGNTSNGAAAGTQHPYAFTARTRDGGGATLGSADSNTVVSEVVEPAIGDLAKTIVSDAADAGDRIAYRLTFRNDGDAAAFEVALVDPVAAALSLDTTSVVVSPGTLSVSDASTAAGLDLTVARLDPGQGVTVDFEAVVDAAAAAGLEIENTASLGYTGLPGDGSDPNPTGSVPPAGDERTGAGGGTDSYQDVSAPVTTSLADPSIAVALIDPPSATAAVGDELRYRITVTLPEGTTRDLVVDDLLPPGVRYLTHTVDATGFDGTLPSPTVTVGDGAAPVDPGEDPSFDFGDVVVNAAEGAGPSSFTIDVVARVADVPGTVRGTVLPHDAELDFSDPESGSETRSASAADVTVIEPELAITLTADADTSAPIDAGTPVTYTVRVEHLPLSDADAHDLEIRVPLPAELDLTGVTPPADARFGTVIDGSDTGAGNVVLLTVGTLPDDGSPLEFSFTAELLASAAPGQEIGTTAFLDDFTSQPGSPDDDRSYADPGDPDHSDDHDVLAVTPALGVAKRVEALESNGDGSYRLVLGYTVENLGDVQLDGVRLDDALSDLFAGSGVAWTVDALSAVGLGTNTGYDGDAAGDPTLASGSLAVGASAEVTLELTVTLSGAADLGSYQNNATAVGASPGGIGAPQDLSNHDPDPGDADPNVDPDGDGDATEAGENEPTPVVFAEAPALSLAKTLPASFDFGAGSEANPRLNADGSSDVAFVLTLENSGDMDLDEVELDDDLSGFAGVTIESVSLSSADLPVNPAFDGIADTSVLFDSAEADDGVDLAAGGGPQQVVLRLRLRPDDPGDLTVTYSNDATASGASAVFGTPVTAADDATVNLSERPVIGISKGVAGVVDNGDGSYRVTLLFTVENLGDVDLAQVQVEDDLSGFFDGEVTLVSLAASGTLTPNLDDGDGTAFDGLSDPLLLDAAASTLPVGARETLTLSVDVVPTTTLTDDNSATAGAVSPAAQVVSDVSNFDPDLGDADPNLDPNGNDDPAEAGEDTPTPVTLAPVARPAVGLSKAFAALDAVAGSPGSFDVTLVFVAENLGNVALDDVQIRDDLAAVFSDGSVTSVLSVTGGGAFAGLVAPGFTGDPAGGGDALLVPGVGLATPAMEAAGLGEASGSVTLVLRVTPTDPSGSYLNQAEIATVGADGSGPAGDLSNDDPDPGDADPNVDPDGDGDATEAGENEPTEITFETPVVGIAKQLVEVRNLGDGDYLASYTFTVVNYGDVPLSDLAIRDDLAGQLAAAVPVAFDGIDGSLDTVDGAYDGQPASNLLAPGQSLPVGGSGSAGVQVRLRPGAALAGGSLTLQNQAGAEGTSPGGQTVADTSVDGTDPNPDGSVVDGFEDPSDDASPTEAVLTEAPAIGLALAADPPLNNHDGSYDVTFTLTLENLGDVELDDLTLPFALGGPGGVFEDADSVVLLGVDDSGSPVATAPGYDGTAGGSPELLAPGQTLAPGESATLTVTVQVVPGAELGPYLLQPQLTGTSPGTQTVDDLSDDGLDPDPDGDGDAAEAGENDPTPVLFEETPVLGLAKRLVSVDNLTTGVYDVTFEIRAVNLGDVVLRDLQIADDLDAAFDVASGTRYTVLSLTSPDFTVNLGYDGSTDTDLLAGGDELPWEGEGSLTLVVRVVPITLVNTGLANQAVGSATSPAGAAVDDLSTDGTDPDADASPTNSDGVPTVDGDGDPNEDAPTPIVFVEIPRVGLAKRLVSNTHLGDGSFEVVFELVLENLGNVELRAVQIEDDLTAAFGAGVARVLAVESADLTADPGYDGAADTTLLAGSDTVPVGGIRSVRLTLLVAPAGPGTFENQARAAGTAPSGAGVADPSTDGADPDPDGDGVADEAGENDPTPVTFAVDARLGVAKAATVRANADGSYDVELSFVLENLGDVRLDAVQLSDDLGVFYDGAGLSAGRIVVVASELSLNPDFDGRSDPRLLRGDGSLAPGERARIVLRLEGLRPVGASDFENRADATATTPFGAEVEDASVDGDDPDPDGDGDPSESSPTPIALAERPLLGVAKAAEVGVNPDGSFDVTFTLTVANLGNTPLLGVQLDDDLSAFYAGTDLTPDRIALASDDLTVNPGYDGRGETRLLRGDDTLGVGEDAALTLILRRLRPSGDGLFENSAFGRAKSPFDTPVSDPSAPGLDPDPDGDGDPGGPGEDDPTPVVLVEAPAIGVAKAATVTANLDGSFDVGFTLTLANLGNAPLEALTLSDDLGVFYDGAGLTSDRVALASDDLTVNPGYDGRTDPELLAPGQGLAVGERARVTLTLAGLRPLAGSAFENLAFAGGTSPSGVPAPEDASDDGFDPDPDGDGDPGGPGEDDPTPVVLVEAPAIGVAKAATVTANLDGSFDVGFTLTLANLGNAPLESLSLVDDLTAFYAGTDLVPGRIALSSDDLVVNPGYDGRTDPELLAPDQTLAVGDEATLTLTLSALRPAGTTSFDNAATVRGTSPAGTVVSDLSDDGFDPDPDGDGDPGGPGEDDPTPVVLVEAPAIGVAKAATVTVNGDGSFDLVFRFVLENLGNAPLTDLGLRDLLSAVYANTDLSPDRIALASDELTVNPGYDGAADPQLLAPGQTLAVGARATVTLTLSELRVTGSRRFDNTATAVGTSPGGTPVDDASVDGDDPDPDSDGDPSESSPTPVVLPEGPVLGLAKAVELRPRPSGGSDLVYTLILVNLGDVTLNDLSLRDPLTGVYAGTDLTPDRVALASDDLTVNPGYDGRTDPELLAPGQGLAVGERARITLTLSQVRPNPGVTRVRNSALAQGTSPGGTTVADASTDGDDPDPGGDGPGDDATPTVAVFAPTLTLLLQKEAPPGPYGIGDTVPYTLTLGNPNDEAVSVTLRDLPPARTAYVAGSAAITPAGVIPGEGPEPETVDGELLWRGLVIPANGEATVRYRLRVLPGADAPLLNSAVASGRGDSGRAVASGTVSAEVRIDAGVFDRERSTLIGRVYLDLDRDGRFDRGVDLPLPGARVVLTSGWQTVTDAEGNYAFRDLESGVWTVLLDRRSAPFAPLPHPEASGDDGRLHRVRVQGLTVSDFPLEAPVGWVDARRETRVRFGPVTLVKRHLPLPDAVRVVLELSADGPAPPLIVTDPAPDGPRTFEVDLAAGPQALSYDLPAGSPFTDPELRWSDR